MSDTTGSRAEGPLFDRRADKADLAALSDTTTRIRRAVEGVIEGKRDVVRLAITVMLAEGHLLIEDVPGVGKTMLAKALARSVDCSVRRVQFTPDLLPSDITGVSIYNQERRDFEFKPGAIFANIVVGDEINRASPKTQSALLECMEEHQVTAGGVRYPREEPFFVLATQNPIEMEGTYPLPEAQLDRFFFKLTVGFPSEEQLMTIADRTTGRHLAEVGTVADRTTVLRMIELARELPIAKQVMSYAVQLTIRTHPDRDESPDTTRRFVRYGASPRGLQALVLGAKIRALLEGRFNVAYDDVRAAALPALRHRIILNFEADAEGVTTDRVILDVLSATRTS
ncbi:MAG: MoxR-like ATPase [Actinomycetota bacterium]|nr:MoxR-like ATPase [Actinomycetota bacterium]